MNNINNTINLNNLGARDIRKHFKLCAYCAKPLDRKGLYCSDCNVYWTKYRYNHYTVPKHLKGFCTNCGKQLDREGWHCIACADKYRLRGKARSDYRRQNNLCVQCGTYSPDYAYCQVHREQRMARYYAKKASQT